MNALIMAINANDNGHKMAILMAILAINMAIIMATLAIIIATHRNDHGHTGPY